ncbi:hypothetical protein B8W67_18525 [Mycolicibacillus koreensis]|uniref:Uncharacterized protein n=1 Tax=Mycolicibacillus koreensis TaxID=1069220 RepID=A0AA91PB80_9MYCO|nr:hypothetical protein B8W67_18525 [Mycolicibacillus koreensis]
MSPGAMSPGARWPQVAAPPANDPTPRFNPAAIITCALGFVAPVVGLIATSLLGAVVVLTVDDIEPVLTILGPVVNGTLLVVFLAVAWTAFTGIRRTGRPGMPLVVMGLIIGVPSLLFSTVYSLVTGIGG